MAEGKELLGTGPLLRRIREHPYINRIPVNTTEKTREIIGSVNRERDNSRGPAVEVDYYFELATEEKPMEALKSAAKMILEHGTLKPWHSEGDVNIAKPAGYDEFMSWLADVKLLGYNPQEGLEAGLLTVAYPLTFFDKTGRRKFPMAQMLMAIASEPVSAFSHYQAARIVDIRFPAELRKRLPGPIWPHRRVREYLKINPQDPIIGTIVKPKTGLTPELFSRAVTEAALAGARFTKADENMHLTRQDVARFVKRTARDLEKAGFDLGKAARPKGSRFLFAPHITAEADDIMDYAKAAVESGANALMFSPYYGGGFRKMAEIAETFDVPIYSHTAGMNISTGSPTWGIDCRVMYLLAASFGAAFMQLTAVNGYLKPEDIEKPAIFKRLQADNLMGDAGMTLVIAGGIGPNNIGLNMKQLGLEGRMFLAGTSVYSHPDGASAGVKAIILAYRGYREKGLTETADLLDFGRSLGKEGEPLVHALKKN